MGAESGAGGAHDNNGAQPPRARPRTPFNPLSALTTDQLLFAAADTALPLAAAHALLPPSPTPLFPSHAVLGLVTPRRAACFGLLRGIVRHLVHAQQTASLSFRGRTSHAVGLVLADVVSVGGVFVVETFLPAVGALVERAFVPVAGKGKPGASGLGSVWLVVGAVAVSHAVGLAAVRVARELRRSSPAPTSSESVQPRLRWACKNAQYSPSLLAVRLRVPRRDIVVGSLSPLLTTPPHILRDRVLRVEFCGEAGVDMGAIAREWIGEFARGLTAQLFEEVEVAGTRQHQPSRTFADPSTLTEHTLALFELLGRVFGKSVFEVVFMGDSTMAVGTMLTENVWDVVCGRSTNALDVMSRLDPELHRHLQHLADNPLGDVAGAPFVAVTHTPSGALEQELVQGGNQIFLTEENKAEYARLYAEFLLYRRAEPVLSAFARGFHSIVSKELVHAFDAAHLNAFMFGEPVIDVDDWMSNVVYNDCNENTPVVRYFWEYVGGLSEAKRRALLKFVTASSTVPLGGMANLSPVFKITVLPGDWNSSLPVAIVCHCELVLPPYRSRAELSRKLSHALAEGHAFANQ